MIVVDEAGAGDEVELVLVLLWEVVGLAEGVFVELSVNALLGSFLEHVGANVTTLDIFKSMFVQIFTDQASSTSHVKNLDLGRVFFVLLGEF